MTSPMIGRRYLDPGDRFGRLDPPVPVVVLVRWDTGAGAPGPVRWLHGRVPSLTGPRNVLVQREDGSRLVVPFSRRLRRDDR